MLLYYITIAKKTFSNKANLKDFSLLFFLGVDVLSNVTFNFLLLLWGCGEDFSLSIWKLSQPPRMEKIYVFSFFFNSVI